MLGDSLSTLPTIHAHPNVQQQQETFLLLPFLPPTHSLLDVTKEKTPQIKGMVGREDASKFGKEDGNGMQVA